MSAMHVGSKFGAFSSPFLSNGFKHNSYTMYGAFTSGITGVNCCKDVVL